MIIMTTFRSTDARPMSLEFSFLFNPLALPRVQRARGVHPIELIFVHQIAAGRQCGKTQGESITLHR